MFFIAKFIAATFGLDVSRVQRWVIIATIAVVGLIVLFFALWVRSCVNKPAKLNQKEIIAAQQAIEKHDLERQKQILAESDVREQGIDNSIKAAENATEQAKKSYDSWTPDQLADELNRRAQQP